MNKTKMLKQTTKEKATSQSKKKDVHTPPKMGEYTAAALEYGRSNATYKKVGRKYVQVNDTWIHEGLAEGWHLIHVKPGCVSERIRVYPAYLELEAAILEKSDELVKLIQAAVTARPSNRTISKAAYEAWQKLTRCFPDDFSLLEYDSIQGIADQILDGLTRNKKRND